MKCACGCGNDVRSGRFVQGHGRRRSGTEYVEKDCGYGTPCWQWQLSTCQKGYGFKWDGERLVRAHRWYYEQAHGSIVEGFQIDHLCRNKACVNPAHLEPVVSAENLCRGKKAKLTWEKVDALRQAFQVWEGSGLAFATPFAEQWGLHPCSILLAAQGKTWRHERPDTKWTARPGKAAA